MDSLLSIVHVLDKNRFDTGSVNQMFQAAAGLRAKGHAVTIVSRHDSNLARRAVEHSVGFVAAPFSSDFDLRTIAVLCRVFSGQRADVVHVHKGRPHTLALAATWRNPVPAFVVNRGVSFPLTVWNRPKFRTARVDRIVTVCEAIRQVVIRTARVVPEKVEVVFAGTDTAHFDPARWDGAGFRGEKKIPLEDPLIVQVGVRDWKGWRELVAALQAVRQTEPRARLALVGCRSEEEIARVNALAGLHGLRESVLAVEVRDDMPRVLAAADCVVDASWAGTGITGTIREAMAMARPVVATDVGGNRELVASPDVGWLVPPRHAEALAGALAQALRERERSAAVGAAARERVRQQFSKEVRIARLESLYRAILSAKGL